MANITGFIVQDPSQTVKWGQEATVASTTRNVFNPLMGKSDDHIIKVDIKFKSSEDANIAEMSMRGLVRGDGVQGNTDFDDNTDTLEYLHQEFRLEILGNSIKSKNKKLESGRAVGSFRDEAKLGLADWAADRSARFEFGRLSENCTNIVACKAGGDVYNTNGTSPIVAGDYFSTAALDRMLLLATTAKDSTGARAPKIRPYMVKTINKEGVEIYLQRFVYIAHSEQVEQLVQDPIWKDAQKMARERGDTNPIVSGEIGTYRGIVVMDGGAWTKEYAGCVSSTTVDLDGVCGNFGIYAGTAGYETRVGLFLGATAGMIAMDSGFNYYEDTYDMGRKMQVAIDRAWSFQKTKFQGITAKQKELVWHGKDYGVIACVSAKLS